MKCLAQPYSSLSRLRVYHTFRPAHWVSSSRGIISCIQTKGSRWVVESARPTCAFPSITSSRVCFPPEESRHAWHTSARTLHAIHQRNSWTLRVGAEPGIGEDALYEDADLSPNCASEIKIIDYSHERIMEHPLTSDTLPGFLNDTPKPAWATCRWIYVNGLNWDVVRFLGNHKQLHRLAIEDVLDTNTTAKVDWYDNSCFMELPLQRLVELHIPDRFRGQKRSNAATLSDGLQHQPQASRKRVKWHTFSHGKFGMSVEQVSIFLTADNTVITIFERSGHEVLEPLLTRLNSPQTVVRASNDPSMLVQAVIDTIVDLSLVIDRAVADSFTQLEMAVLDNPAIHQSKQVYVLRSGLTHLMDNTIAIGSVVKTLSEHNALVTPTDGAVAADPLPHSRTPTHKVSISPLAQVYLRDVQDHVQTLSNSTHMSIRSAENLTSLIFNTIAASQNESVRQLTLISSFFLPLTFLTGYFGMNFNPMPIVNEHSDVVFWALAGPIMLVTSTFLFLRSRRIRSIRFWRRLRESQPKDSSNVK